MGRQKSMIRQVSERLHSMAAYGQSKHTDKLGNGGKPAIDKIYSFSTMCNYHQAACDFAHWARDTHHCRTLDQARQYTGEYLQQRMDSGRSAWTVRRDAAALAKVYQCKTTDLGVTLPARHRGDVTQHSDRTPQGFAESRHADLAALCRSTGLRRHEVEQLRPQDVRQDAEGRTVVRVEQGKGGKSRDVVALDNTPARLAAQATAAGNDRVIDHIPGRAPIHAWRRDYASALYDRLARDVATLSPADQYRCKLDQSGTVYDRQALAAVSVALGHSRIGVATHYVGK